METTTELATSLSLAASRWIVEADGFLGNLLKGQIVGVIGAGRIVSAYARTMIEGFKMNLIYYDFYQATRLEKFVTAYDQFLKEPVTWKHTSLMDEVLQEADVIYLMFRFAMIKGYLTWLNPNQVDAFWDENSPSPSACPSIVNAKQLELLK
uniref:D-isomer specific 2-hydroxyacid dehydrogenase NAD-binding domain-containing protein n=1 Tax=Lactuca sativa TaxID=4236 RepID=A0A9R1V6X6_LACSA|nr:hypothetical protein LSAT_V11C600311500 [Lactuca sativa]